MSLQAKDAEFQLKNLQDTPHADDFQSSSCNQEIRLLLTEMNGHLKEMDHILQKLADQNAIQRSIRKAISSEMVKAQQQITEESQAMIEQTAKTGIESLEAVGQRSRKQIERLARVTFSDHLFRTLKLVILLLAFFVLGYYTISILAGWF